MNSESSIRIIPNFSVNKMFKYLSVAQISFSNSFVYLTNVFSHTFPIVIRVWIFVQLYEISFSANDISEVNGLTVAMTVWILAFTQSFHSSTRPPISRTLNNEVRSGDLQYVISRPYSYIGFHYFSQLGRAFAFLLPLFVVSSATAWFFVGGIKLTFQGLGWGLVLLILGITLDFLMSFLIGIMAFWIEDSTSLTWIYHKAQLIFGGLLIPIGMFPEKIKGIAEILPFSQIYYGAASMMVAFDMQVFKRFLLIQMCWIVFFLILAIVTFRRGIKKVSINGG